METETANDWAVLGLKGLIILKPFILVKMDGQMNKWMDKWVDGLIDG